MRALLKVKYSAKVEGIICKEITHAEGHMLALRG